MANRAPRYKCPDCGRKTVYFAFGQTISGCNTDGYYCSRCSFDCFASTAATFSDRTNMARLEQVNPVLRPGYDEAAKTELEQLTRL